MSPGKDTVLRRIFGTLDWQPPPWWRPLAARVDRGVAWAAAHRARAAAAGLALLVAASLVLAGAWWWRTRPQPQYLPLAVEAPAARDLLDPESKPAPVRLRFGEPAAPLAAIGTEVNTGVRLSPAASGRWRWEDETTLAFEPAGDWPVGQRYVVELGRGTLRDGVRLESDRIEFRSAPLAASFEKAEFYQDPVDPRIKKVVVNVRFSHPVDPASFERTFRLLAGRKAEAFTATYDEKRLWAYVQSGTLALPDEPQSLRVVLGAGVRSALGGPELGAAQETTVTVPGRLSLAVEEASPGYVTNAQYESEQVLTVALNQGVAPAELRGRLRAWLLPAQHPDRPAPPDGRPFEWNTPALVADEILALASRVELEPLEATDEHPRLHAFRFRAPAGRHLYLRVDAGLQAFGGFGLAKRWDATPVVPEPPREVKMLQGGSLLSLRGERKLALYSRDLPAIRYEVGRVAPDRLYLLATQADGAFGNPQFNGWSLSFDDLADVQSEIETVPAAAAPGRVHYHGLDLGPYVAPQGRQRTGVFFVRAQGWDPVAKRPLEAADERLVLVTDLGLVVKRAVDGSEDVFVQSLSRGEPVAGAIVQLLGRNGLALATRSTDEQGRARLPSFRDAQREREPALYLVRKDEDAAFLPVRRSDRLLDLSRFEVGGVSNPVESGQLSAYLFSDRGIYRPGDELKVGMIVKAADWATPLEGLPLEAVITDPRGQVVRRQRLRLTASGFEELAHATSESSPTGAWDVALYLVEDGAPQARIGGTVVDVQEFLPDRMKLALRFSSERESGWVSPQDLAANVDLRTLFDTPAGGRRVTATLRLTPRLPQFDGWQDWQFADPEKARKTFEDTLAETTTDAAGAATLPLGLQRFEPGSYALQLVVQAFEPGGGRGVTQARTLRVSGQPFLVGLKGDGELGYVAKDAARTVQLVALDPALKPVAVPGLRAAIVERRFVSVLERQPDGTLRYASRRKEVPVEDQPLSLPAGTVARTLPTGTPGDYALVVRDAGGRELNRIEYSVAGAGNVARRMDRNAELELRLARAEVAPGEELEVSVRAPFAGTGLITIERERVHAFRWFRADTTASVQRIRVPDDFDGNGYVSVSFVRDPNSAEVFTSPLSFGVVPFTVDLGRRRLEVRLEAPTRLRPGQTLELTYRASRRSRMVVFGVDEGILQVAGWRTPDPLGHFFEKRALEVDTRQILDLLLPEFQAMVQPAPGGDAAGGGAKYLNPFKRRRDRPVAFWSGVVDAGPDPARFSYVVPDSFNGSMRLVAVAVAADGVGVASTQLVSRGDFVILPNAPLAVAPGDEFELTAGVTNNVEGEGGPLEVATRLEASEHFEVLGAAQAVARIAPGREAVVRFRLRARQALGSGSLRLVSSAGARRASATSSVSLRPAAAFQVQLHSGSFDAGRVEVPLARALRPERRRLEASVSASPLAIAGGLEAWLAEYPYGCTEQLVSQALPAVLLGARPELGRSNLAAAPERWSRLLVELRARQNADGGFGYWPSDPQAASYPSVYALHALVEAQQRGAPAPRDVQERGAAWLAEFAAGDAGGLALERSRAYAIYVLTRQARVASNLANAQVERLDARLGRRWRSDITAAWLAAAYQSMRQAAPARELLAGVKFSDPARPWPAEVDDDATGYVYSAAVHDAQLAFVLARHFPERLREQGPAALAALTAAPRRGHSTASAAWAVLALDAWAASAEAGPPPALTIEEVRAGGQSRALEARGTSVRRAAFAGDATALRFGAPRGTRAYWTATLAGYDREPPRVAQSLGLEVVRDYLGADGRPVTSVLQGDELTVRVRFRSLSPRAYWDGVLVDVLPGGFEPILDGLVRNADGDTATDDATAAGSGTAAVDARWYPDHVDVREDRVVAFGTIGPQARELRYRIRATTAGRFAVPPAHAESMYDPAVQARSTATQVVVEAR
ncbi:MAG: alpha-2-macroglobulin family protein [Steroidobacteraceae bacterium]|jgi:hypothetical protein|nr:alpha-2-macroglobulin family protein [Steroidobacteraceae bacterium]